MKLNSSADEVVRAIEDMGQWLDGMATGEATQKAVGQRLLELAALLFHAPASFQAEYLYWIAKDVIGMPMVVLASATDDDGVGDETQKAMRIEFQASCNGIVAPGLGPIIQKLRDTADAYEKMMRECPFKGHAITIHDSSAAPAAAKPLKCP